MKNIIVIISSLLLMFWSYNMDAQSETDTSLDKFEVKVDGLGCPFCAYGLEKKFKDFDNIDEVKIEMETGIMTFIYPTEDSLDLVSIEEKVEEAGYTPVHVLINRASGEIEDSRSAANVESLLSEEARVLETSVFVAGNCGMCKARIEKTAKAVSGVIEANWDKESKMISLEYDAAQSSIDDIERAIAEAGHDTANWSTSTEIYDALPPCCQYEREENSGDE